MKIGTFEDNNATVEPLSTAEPINPISGMGVDQPAVAEVIFPEEDLDPDSGLPITMRNATYRELSPDTFDNAVLTMEDEEFDLQQKMQQMNLLQDAFSTIEDTENVSPAQVKAIGVQLSMLDKFIPREDRIMKDAHIGAASEDTAQNKVVTQEALGSSMKVLIPIIAAIGVMLGGLYFFLRSKKIAERQASRNDATFKAMQEQADAAVKVARGMADALTEGSLAAVTGGSPTRIEDLDSVIFAELNKSATTSNLDENKRKELAGRLAKLVERTNRSYARFNFLNPTILDKGSFVKAFDAYGKYSDLGVIGEELAANLSKQLKEASTEMARGTIEPARANQIADKVGEAVDQAVARIKALGQEVSMSQLHDMFTTDDRESKYYSFPMFPGSAGPVLAIKDNRVFSLTANREASVAVTSKMKLMDYISLKAAYSSVPNATRKAEKAADQRRQVGNQITELARKMKGVGNTDEERSGIRGLTTELNTARAIITALDKTWLDLCASANALTDLAHASLDLSKAMTTVAQEAKETPSAPAQEPSNESLTTSFEDYDADTGAPLPPAVATNEAIPINVLVSIFTLVAATLASLYIFLKEKKVAEQQKARTRKIMEDAERNLRDSATVKARYTSRDFADSLFKATAAPDPDFEKYWSNVSSRLDEELNNLDKMVKDSEAAAARRAADTQRQSEAKASSPDAVPPEAKNDVVKLRRVLRQFHFQRPTELTKNDISMAADNYMEYTRLGDIGESLGESIKQALQILQRELTDDGISPEANDRITQGLTKSMMQSHDAIKQAGTPVSASQVSNIVADNQIEDGGGVFVLFPLFKNSVSAVLSVSTKGAVRQRSLTSEGREVDVGINMNFSDFMSLKSKYASLADATGKAEAIAQERAKISADVNRMMAQLKKHKAFNEEGSTIKGINNVLAEAAKTIRAIDQTWLKLCGDSNRLIEIMALVKNISSKGSGGKRDNTLEEVERVN